MTIFEYNVIFFNFIRYYMSCTKYYNKVTNHNVTGTRDISRSHNYYEAKQTIAYWQIGAISELKVYNITQFSLVCYLCIAYCVIKIIRILCISKLHKRGGKSLCVLLEPSVPGYQPFTLTQTYLVE